MSIHHEAEALLRWRAHQRHGEIMRTKTFKRIVRRARAAGARDPYAVAGAAYWRTVEARYRHRPRRRHRNPGFATGGLWMAALVGLALLFIAKPSHARPASVPPEAVAQVDATGRVTEYVWFDQDGAPIAVWDPLGNPV